MVYQFHWYIAERVLRELRNDDATWNE